MPRKSARTNGSDEKDTPMSRGKQIDKSKEKSTGTGKVTQTSSKKKRQVNNQDNEQHEVKTPVAELAEGNLSDEGDFDMQSSPPVKTKSDKMKRMLKSKNAKEPAEKQEKSAGSSAPMKTTQSAKTKWMVGRKNAKVTVEKQEKLAGPSLPMKTTKSSKTKQTASGRSTMEPDFKQEKQSAEASAVKTTKSAKTKQMQPGKSAKEQIVKREKQSSRSKRKKDVADDADENKSPAKKQNTSVKVEKSQACSSAAKTNKEEENKRRKRKGINEAVVPPKKTVRNSRPQAKASVDANNIPVKKSKGRSATLDKGMMKNVDIKKKEHGGDLKLGRRIKEEEDESIDMVEEMSSDSSESEWEEVEDLPLDVIDPSLAADDAGPSGESKEPVEISIDISGGNTLRSKRKQKHEDMWRRYLQWQVNKSNKELQENLHKVHLLCLLASGLRSSSLCNDIELQSIAFSHIPDFLMPRTSKKVDNYYLPKFFKWFKSSFEVDAQLRDDSSVPMNNKLIQSLERRKTSSENELVLVCILLLRALGLDVRLVASLHPITIKAIKLTKANKRLSKAKVNKSTPSSSKTTKSTKVVPHSKTAKTTKKVPHSKAEPVTSKFFQSPPEKPSSSSSSKRSKTDSTTMSNKTNKLNLNKSKTTKDQNPQDKTISNTNSQDSVTSGPRPKNRQPRKCASKVKPIIDVSGSELESSDDEYHTLESETSSDDEDADSKKLVIKRKKQNSASRKKRTSTLSESESDYEESNAKKKGLPQRTKQHGKRTQEHNSDCEEVSNSKVSKQKTKRAKAEKNTGGDSSVEELNSDSDFDVEVIKVASGPRNSSSSGEGSGKKQSKKMLSSDSEESVEIIKTKGDLYKQGTDSWLEVYSESDKAWICVDCVHGHVKRPQMCESYASKPMIYVVAFDNEGSIKDITHRYDSKWMIGTQKLRVDPEWWQETLHPFRTRNTRRDREEDDKLQVKLMDKPLPSTISEYKGHPLYALKRHLLKFEGLYPETAAILGYCRGEAVYARECVHELHTRQTWLKEAKLVRIGEKPYKMVKARPKRNQKQETEPSLEVFGAWQTEDYIPPPAVDGIVPRNEHGNVELFKECMLPGGTVHMRLVGLNRIARKLEIDCAPAMTGWDFHSGFCHPVLDGYVVCEEYEDLLIDAWHKEQQEIERKNRKKKEDRALKNWKLLIKGVFIRERLNKRFKSDEGAGTSSPSKTKAKKSEKVAWPKNRMTAFEGDKNNKLPFEKL